MGSFATRRRLVIPIAAAAAIAIGASACGGGSSSSGNNANKTGSANVTSNLKSGGTINFPLYAEPVSITPLHGQESEGTQVEKSIFAGLVDYDAKTLKVIPSMASSWSSNSNATVWTFHLRSGIYFYPKKYGQVTADTFVKDWGIACAKDTASEVSYILAPIKGFDQCAASTNHVLSGVKALDPHTLQVTLSNPFADFPTTLGHPVSWAFPPQLADTPAKQKQFEHHPVGAGPFYFVSWDHNKDIVIKKNPDFFGVKAHIDEVNFPIFPDGDESAAFLAFKAGKLDYATVPTGQVRATQSDPKLGKDYYHAPELAIYYYGFTLKGNNPVAKNKTLRQAINYATNSPAVVNQVNEGVPTVADGLVPPGIPGYTKGVSPYHYDPAKAKQLLKQSGFKGQLTLGYNTDQGHQRIAEALIQGYKAVGLNVKAENFEWGTYLDKLEKGEFSFWRLGWIADYPSMDNFIYPMFYSKEAGNNNVTFYNNPKVDQMLLKARAETDTAKRDQMYTQIEKVILADAPEIPIYFYGRAGVISPQAQNFLYDAMGIAHFNLMGVDPSKPAT